MALFDTTWYVNAGDQSITGYYAVAKWTTGTKTAGTLIRQNATPAFGDERVFVCIVGGAAGGSEPAWTVTRGGKTTDNAVTWQECTGASAVNGDLTNTPNWTTVKGLAVTLGQIIKRNSGSSYQICSTAGTAGSGSEPGFSDTAGTTTSDNTITWTSLGVVGSFSGGGAPHARLTNAFATNWFAAGNTIYIGDNNAETSTSTINFQPAGSTTTISSVICHNHSGSYPPATGDLTTGATITTTAGFADIRFIPSSGGYYLRGLTLVAGSTGTFDSSIYLGLNSMWLSCEDCSFHLASSSSGSTINLSQGTHSVIIFNNVTVKFGNVANTIVVATGSFTWQNTGQVLVSGSSVPNPFMVYNLGFQSVMLEAVDLSQLTGSIISSSSSTSPGVSIIKDCKLNAGYSVGTPSQTGVTSQLMRSDSGATTYKSARYQREGTETTETSITRVGGAADPTGQAQSRKIVTTSSALWLRPFKAEPYGAWNPTTGANVTVTVCGTINSASLPNNDDIWMEVEYLGTASYPLGVITSTTKANLLSSNAAVSSDGSTWNGGGSGAGWSPFKLALTLSSPQPQFAGYIFVRIRAAKASTTYYIDPQITLT